MATAEQIGEWIGVAVRAGISAELRRVSDIATASSHDVVFAASLKSYKAALNSQAGLILTSSAFCAGEVDTRVVAVPDPRLAFAQVAHRLAPGPVPEVHASAILSPTAAVAEGVSIGPGSVVGAYVQIGAGCVLGAGVILEAGTILGKRVRVQSGAVLGAWGFGYVRLEDGRYLPSPQQGILVVEDDVEIGANTTIDRGALGETRIGAGTKIDNLVHIGHNCRIGHNVIIAAQTGISGSSVVEDGAILGGQVGIGEHATVGPEVILGGGAGVLSGKKLRGPGEVFWGRPAQPLKQYLRDLARLRRGQ